MATYTTTLTLNAGATEIDFAVASISPLPPAQIELSAVLYNTLPATDYDFSSTLFPNINQIDSPPYTVSLLSTTAGFGSVYNDGVYRYYGSFADGISEDYSSEAYMLNTTAIDAGIPLMPQTTGREIATYNAAVVIRQDIQDYFDAEDYTNANIWIIYLTNLLAGVSAGGALVPLATLPAAVTINTELADTTAVFPTAFGYYNVITNTLLSEEYPYTWAFAPNSAVSQNNNTTQTIVYPDGVYTDYVSVLCTFDDEGNYPALLNEGTAYLLVTTTVDAQVTLYGDNYDPTNEAEAIAYASMLALQTAIDEAFAAEAYTEANDLIVQLQNLLGEGTSITLLANLSAPQSMVVYFETLPEGTYTNATGTIENTLTGVSATFDGFPSENTDLTTILNSEDLGFGTDFPDGVYQLTVNFYVDGLLFTSMCYLVVTTDWQCCIDKAVGKKCGKLNVALQQSNLTNAVRIVAVYLDVNTANSLIAEGNRVCSGCGCGCK